MQTLDGLRGLNERIGQWFAFNDHGDPDLTTFTHRNLLGNCHARILDGFYADNFFAAVNSRGSMTHLVVLCDLSDFFYSASAAGDDHEDEAMP